MRSSGEAARSTGEERERFVRALFDRIAGRYDPLNRRISFGRDRAWRRAASSLANVRPGERAVDLGTGTGDLFAELARRVGPKGSAIGIDLSSGMLEVAAEKLRRELGFEPDLRLGNACATGLEDATADVVAMGWVLRNVGDRQAAYAEILRLLAPGGRFVCIDMSRPRSRILRALHAVHLRGIMPVLVRGAGGDRAAYDYLAASTCAFPDAPELAAEMRAAGFGSVRWRRFMLGAVAVHVATR